MLELKTLEKSLDYTLESETKESLRKYLLEERCKQIFKKHKNDLLAQNLISKSQFKKAFEEAETEIIVLIRIFFINKC